MAAPTLNSVGTGHETSVTWPSHASGDIGLLFVEHGGGIVDTPTDWAVLPGFPVYNSANNMGLSGFYRVATSGSESAAALASGTDHMWGVIIVVRGVDSTTPVAHSAAMGGSGAVTLGFTPGIGTTTAENLVVQVVAWGLDNAGPLASSWTNASLSSFDEEYDAGTTSGNGGGLTIAVGEKATAGAVTHGEVTLSSTQFCGGTVALQPPQAAAGAGYSRGRVVNP